MADTSRGSWQTVVDPEEQAWREMAAQQRARNAAQAAEADRKHRARRIEGAAGRAGDVVTAAEVGTATNAYLSGSTGAKRLAKAVAKRAGPVGLGISAVEAGSRYAADRAKGMPQDEAIIRRGGEFVFGLGGGVLGGVVGGTAAALLGPEAIPVGGVVGASYGSRRGERFADDFADVAMDVKHRIGRTARGLTDPAYAMRLLRSY
jgi:hypothetical protein